MGELCGYAYLYGDKTVEPGARYGVGIMITPYPHMALNGGPGWSPSFGTLELFGCKRFQRRICDTGLSFQTGSQVIVLVLN